jgi:hypothetical protein
MGRGFSFLAEAPPSWQSSFLLGRRSLLLGQTPALFQKKNKKEAAKKYASQQLPFN